ncbi:MAG: hypothetical protein ACKVPX_08790 [Myxococcaceae bacterium]
MSQKTLGYAESILDAFHRAGGHPWAPSSRDRDMMDQWSQTGIPPEVIELGIFRRAESGRHFAPPGTAPLRTLSSCDEAVQEEWSRFRALRAGARSAPSEQEPPWATSALAAAKHHHPHLASRFDQVAEKYAALLHRGQGELVPLLLARALPFQERIVLLREARRLGMESEAKKMSGQSTKASRNFFRSAALRHALGL